MPRVPQYGDRTPQVDLKPLPAVRARSDLQAGDFGVGLGQALEQVGRLMDQRAAEMKEEEDAAAVTEATATALGQMRDIMHNPDTGIYARKGKQAVGATQSADADIGKIGREIEKGLANDEQKAAFHAMWEQRRQSALDSTARHEANERSRYRVDAARALIESARETAVANYTDQGQVQESINLGLGALRANLSGQHPDAIHAAETEFRSNVHVGVIERMMVNDLKGARAYYREHEQQIQGTSRTQVEQTFQRLKKQQAAEYRAHLATVKDAVKDATYVLERGFVPPNIEQVKAMAKGTPYAAELQQGVNQARQAREFATLRPDQREQALQTLRADAEKGRGEVESLQRLERVNAELNALADKDPVSYAVEIGLGTDPGPMDFSSQESLGESLRQRKALALAASDHLGRPVSPLTLADQAMFERAMGRGGKGQQVRFMGSITQHLGKDLARQAFTDLDKKRGAQFGMAGLMVTEGQESVATQILDGMAQRKTNSKIVPTDTDLAAGMTPVYQAFRDQPEKAGRYIDAAKNIYASLAADEGLTDGAFDDDLWKEAIESATGGLVVFGESTLLPPAYGWDVDRFTTWIQSIDGNQIDAMGGWSAGDGYELKELIRKKRATLETIDRGRYLVRIGDRYVANKAGQPFVLEYQR